MKVSSQFRVFLWSCCCLLLLPIGGCFRSKVIHGHGQHIGHRNRHYRHDKHFSTSFGSSSFPGPSNGIQPYTQHHVIYPSPNNQVYHTSRVVDIIDKNPRPKKDPYLAIVFMTTPPPLPFIDMAALPPPPPPPVWMQPYLLLKSGAVNETVIKSRKSDQIDRSGFVIAPMKCGIRFLDEKKSSKQYKPPSWPWRVHLRYHTNGDQHICIGTLIGNRYILTSASCFDEPFDHLLAWRIRIDGTNVDGFHSISNVFTNHLEGGNHGVAVVVLKQQFLENEASKQSPFPICLPTRMPRNESIEEQQVCYVVQTSTNEEFLVSGIGKGSCSSISGDKRYVCAAVDRSQTNGRAVPELEAGTPLICKSHLSNDIYVVRGILPVASDSRTTGLSFINVEQTIGWIKKVVAHAQEYV